MTCNFCIFLCDLRGISVGLKRLAKSSCRFSTGSMILSQTVVGELWWVTLHAIQQLMFMQETLES